MDGYRDVIAALKNMTTHGGGRPGARASALLVVLEDRAHPVDDVAPFLSRYRDLVSGGSDGRSPQAVSRITAAMLSHLETRHGLVAPGHYRNRWMALGIAVFGVPLGVVFGLSLDNMAFVGIGLPIGLSIGIAVGTAMDGKVRQEGRQLAIPE